MGLEFDLLYFNLFYFILQLLLAVLLELVVHTLWNLLVEESMLYSSAAM